VSARRSDRNGADCLGCVLGRELGRFTAQATRRENTFF
jgi:hypothetical protein